MTYNINAEFANRIQTIRVSDDYTIEDINRIVKPFVENGLPVEVRDMTGNILMQINCEMML